MEVNFKTHSPAFASRVGASRYTTNETVSAPDGSQSRSRWLGGEKIFCVRSFLAFSGPHFPAAPVNSENPRIIEGPIKKRLLEIFSVFLFSFRFFFSFFLPPPPQKHYDASYLLFPFNSSNSMRYAAVTSWSCQTISMLRSMEGPG
jgi:hypothetical protein